MEENLKAPEGAENQNVPTVGGVNSATETSAPLTETPIVDHPTHDIPPEFKRVEQGQEIGNSPGPITVDNETMGEKIESLPVGTELVVDNINALPSKEELEEQQSDPLLQEQLSINSDQSALDYAKLVNTELPGAEATANEVEEWENKTQEQEVSFVAEAELAAELYPEKAEAVAKYYRDNPDAHPSQMMEALKMVNYHDLDEGQRILHLDAANDIKDLWKQIKKLNAERKK